jgi:hypothetical protein
VGKAISSLGLIELGRSYATAADHLVAELGEGRLELHRAGPVDFLYAHALELMLKAWCLEADPATKVKEKFGHDLVGLYDRLKEHDVTRDLRRTVEKKVRDLWKAELRKVRDAYATSLGLPISSVYEDLGMFNNELIGNALPELRNQFLWLGDRHKETTQRFRYAMLGSDSRQIVTGFGVSIDVVWQSAGWACGVFYERFRVQYGTSLHHKD